MNRSHPTHAIVFDLDGTLLDSLSFVLRAFQHALGPFGGRPTMATFAVLGGPPEKIFPRLLADAQDVPAAMLRLQQFHAQNEAIIQPFAGAVALLEQLQALGVKLAVWTGRDRGSTLTLLAVHGLAHFFSVVVCGDDLPSHKPDPEGLHVILSSLAVDPRHTLFIGDADVDVQGGVECRVDTLLISHGRELDPELRGAAVGVVANPADAYDWIRGCVGAPGAK